MKSFVIPAALIILVSCTNNTPIQHLSEAIGLVESTDKLSCRFEKKFTDAQGNNGKTYNWYFWRTADMIETRDELSNQGEIWEKAKNGKLSYTRLFFAHGIALEFTPGDLAAINLNRPWDELNHLIDPNELGKSLKLTGKEMIGNIPVEHYQGHVGGIQSELDWLPALKLPARISKQQGKGNFSLTLSQCNPKEMPKLQPPSGNMAHLRRIDFTDLGDMESDPDVVKLERVIGAHHD